MRKYLTKYIHHSVHQLNAKYLNEFLKHSNDIRSQQISIFCDITKYLEKSGLAKYKGFSKLSYDDFKKVVSLSTYEDYQSDINQNMVNPSDLFCPEIEYFQPTSGSTSELKWIPYNRLFLKQLNNAANAWLSDLYKTYPEIKDGQHYWSLSWLPENLRDKTQLNDEKLFPWHKRQLMKNIMAIDNNISKLKQMDDCKLATIVFLASKPDLRLISVWSPTFLISMLEFLKQNKEKISQILETGNWPKYFNFKLPIVKNIYAAKLILNYSGSDLYQRLWPNLSLISAWDSAASSSFAEKIKKLFPAAKFQGKGLWATEGVVTIPIQGKFLLAYQSHFYEFQNLENDEILTSWQLKKGMKVSPIITTPNGLLRYQLNDSMEVKGFHNNCPELNFIGRKKTCDLVGEKIDYQFLDQILEEFKSNNNLLCFLAVQNISNNQNGYYLLLHQSTPNKEELVSKIEKKMNTFFHYRLAREHNQLHELRAIVADDPVQKYYELCKRKGMIEGNIKIETILTITEDQLYG